MRFSVALVVKVGWLIAVVMVLVWSLWKLKSGNLSSTLEYEVGLANLIFMSVLSFPLGPIILFVTDRIIDLVQPSLLAGDGSLSEVILVWIACVSGGYVQWFIIAPRLYRKVRENLRR